MTQLHTEWLGATGIFEITETLSLGHARASTVATLANCGFYTIRGVNQVISPSAKTFYIYQKMDPLPDGRG